MMKKSPFLFFLFFIGGSWHGLTNFLSRQSHVGDACPTYKSPTEFRPRPRGDSVPIRQK
jgi:hypothetical protein